MERKLDRNRGALPLYKQIEIILKGEIDSGKYQNGEIFPCENQLMEHFNVSRITVRQALSDLSRMGYIQGERGIGTVVTINKINESLRTIKSFSDEMRLNGVTMHTDYCSLSIEKSNEVVASTLGIGIGDDVLFLKRVRSSGEKPLVYSETWLNPGLSLSLDSECYTSSLYAYLDKMGIKIARAKDSLEAIVADSEKAAILDINKGEAIFKRTRCGYDDNGRAIELSVSYYPGTRYKYNIDL